MNAPSHKPICDTNPSRRGGIDLNAVTQAELRLETASLSALVDERDSLGRWLNTPHAELWADQYREKTARIRVVWGTIKRRFPQYALKNGRV